MSQYYNRCWCPKCKGSLRRITTCTSHVSLLQCNAEHNTSLDEDEVDGDDGDDGRIGGGGGDGAGNGNNNNNISLFVRFSNIEKLA